MNRFLATSILLVGAFLVPTKAYAGFPGCLWEGVKTIVSAPVHAVGWLVGQGANAAVDPALDNAFGRLSSTADHALDKFDQLSASRIEQVDKVAKDRLDQLDKIAQNRVAQLDQVMKLRLDQVDQILGKDLQQMESIGAALIEKEAQVLDASVTRIDDILDRSVDRLQDLETDAFDRLEGAVQDQVPYAASQVAQTMEWTVGIIVFIVVLVGFGGVDILRRIRAGAANVPILQRLYLSLQQVPRTLLLAGVPMLLIFAVIQAGYFVYCNRSGAARVARLDDAAQILEQVGDFKGASTFRKRMFALNPTTQVRFQIERNDWLAGFWQKHFGQDSIQTERQLIHLTTSPDFKDYADKDGELRAALIYLSATSLRDRLVENFKELSVPTSDRGIASYKQRFIAPNKSVPVLGKLVYMAELRLALENSSRGVDDRLTDAKRIADELLTIGAYDRYAPALALRATIGALKLELQQRSLKDGPIKNEDAEQMTDAEKAILAPIQGDFTTAMAFDPELMRFIRFRTLSMPKPLVDNLLAINQADPPKRADLKGPDGIPISNVAEQQLNEYAATLDDLVRPLLGIDLLVRPNVEQQVFQRMRQELGERDLKLKVDTARKGKAGGDDATTKYKKFLAVYEAADSLGKLHIAEAWLMEAQNVISDAPDSFSPEEKKKTGDKLTTVRSAPLATRLFVLF